MAGILMKKNSTRRNSHERHVKMKAKIRKILQQSTNTKMKHGTSSPLPLRRKQLSQHLDLGLPVSKNEREFMMLFKFPTLLLCTGSPSTLMQGCPLKTFS